MDLKRLRTLVTVAEHGTVSKAAAVLHITQPALSRQIHGLEEEIGFTLFERVGRRLVITAQGEQLVEASRGLLTQASQLSDQVGSIRRGELRELRIAGSALTFEAFFPDFSHVYAERFPNTQLKFVEANGTEQLALLEKGAAHFAINLLNVIDKGDRRFGVAPVLTFDLLAAFSVNTKFKKADKVEVQQIAEHPLLVLGPGYPTRVVFDAACRLAHVRPNIVLESSAPHTLIAFAESGHGVAIIPSALRTDPKRLATIRIAHQGRPLHLRPAVLWAIRRTLPSVASDFSRILVDHVRNRFPTHRDASQRRT